MPVASGAQPSGTCLFRKCAASHETHLIIASAGTSPDAGFAGSIQRHRRAERDADLSCEGYEIATFRQPGSAGLVELVPERRPLPEWPSVQDGTGCEHCHQG